jgi:hypothetical protein
MIKKKVLDPNRVRCIERGFSFIPHRFLTEGFLAALNQKELLLYFFLVLVSDRYGLSFYSYAGMSSVCTPEPVRMRSTLFSRRTGIIGVLE